MVFFFEIKCFLCRLITNVFSGQDSTSLSDCANIFYTVYKFLYIKFLELIEPLYFRCVIVETVERWIVSKSVRVASK